jgi:ClpP class serine protease
LKLPTWSEILSELKEAQTTHGVSSFDIVRRKYLAALQQHTGRNTVIYASSWMQKRRTSPENLSINEQDMQGLMEVFHGLTPSANLDLILHSPGGSPEATEAMVYYIRSKFSHVRVIVPHQAMSAATMLACSADKIVMGKHSFLGPIDPQFFVQTALGSQAVPAQAVLDQFDIAKRDCQDPKLLGAWVPMLPQYGPALSPMSGSSEAFQRTRGQVVGSVYV